MEVLGVLGHDKRQRERRMFAAHDPAGVAPKRQGNPQSGPQPGSGGVHDVVPCGGFGQDVAGQKRDQVEQLRRLEPQQLLR